MKKVIIAAVIFVIAYIGWDFASYKMGWYIDFHPMKEPEILFEAKEESFFRHTKEGLREFEIRGVNLGSAIPGKWQTDYAIDKKTYKRWFKQIQEMGANTIRVRTIQGEAFYKAFYEYNKDNKNPLYLIHGIGVNDYIQNSHRDAFDEEFCDAFIRDCRSVVNVVHGNRKISLKEKNGNGNGYFRWDISPWVLGYTLGIDWNEMTVAYTDEKYKGMEGYDSYNGEYVFTSNAATPFEVMLTKVCDKMLEYETKRYKEQRPIALCNWQATDSVESAETDSDAFLNCAVIDTAHIKAKKSYKAGLFAAYNISPDYISCPEYLKQLNKHHEVPVVISQFGVSSGRGALSHRGSDSNFHDNLSEKDQGKALVEFWKDIKSSGCTGGCIASWQDDWSENTWNTMYSINMKRSPYWSDYQSEDQHFGLLAFDPGKKSSICYVDGDFSEWTEDDVVLKEKGQSVSIKYDERYMYFRIHKNGLTFGKEILYIPIDTTQKTGGSHCRNFDLEFARAADFLIVIDGKENSRIMVQERYEALRSTYSESVDGFDTYLSQNKPEADSSLFVPIKMIIQANNGRNFSDTVLESEVYETGNLIYGSANPKGKEYNSLADFICSGDDIEIKIPWELLNFSDPSRMKIHDDYYDDNYGVAYQNIDRVYVGLGSGAQTEKIKFYPKKLKGWGNDVSCHERLKSSYYDFKELWAK